MKDYKVVTVDYDNTLLFCRYDFDRGDTVDWFINHELVNILKEMIAKGVTVYIVTARDKDAQDDDPLHTTPERFCREQKLRVKGIYYTSGQYKAETLIELGSEVHFDDSDEEMIAITAHAPWIDKVLIEGTKVQLGEQLDFVPNVSVSYTGNCMADLAEAFRALDDGDNQVAIADLRDALPQYSRSEIDKTINYLRKSRLLTAYPFEGRHGRSEERLISGGIPELDTVLVYVARV